MKRSVFICVHSRWTKYDRKNTPIMEEGTKKNNLNFVNFPLKEGEEREKGTKCGRKCIIRYSLAIWLVV